MEEEGLVPVITAHTNGVTKEHLLFGTKVGTVVAQLQAILATDPSAKVLVFCQWNSLKRRIEGACKHHKVTTITLEGRPEQLRSSLERFKSSTKGDSNVLVASLDLKAAGLNLQAANHLILVHPFFSTNQKQAVAWEAQALGRLLRPGQTRKVNIWRFVSRNTLEEDILRRNVANVAESTTAIRETKC
jgi:SNF2 family DNA or RNA helicase